MLTLQDKSVQLDDLLNRAAASLQLDTTRQKRMESAYNNVREWIEADEDFFKPFQFEIYPHGSVRTGTTVKPFARNEFDLDVVIHLRSQLVKFSPEKIYQELKRRLSEHEGFKKMLEPKNRCLRLNYAGDFHMDILPGVQESEWDNNKLLVPDRERGTWVSTNPRGYADWLMNVASKVELSLLEKAFSAEALPTDEYRDKKPLQRAIQLIKRSRDIYFDKNIQYKEYPTSSIVLTTLAGQLYSGQASIFESIEGILQAIRNKTLGSIARIKVVNPVNGEEDFTDKWEKEPAHYAAFSQFIREFYNQWQELKRGEGVLKESYILKGLFGDDTIISAQESAAEWLEGYRNAGKLKIQRNTGILSTLTGNQSSPVRFNTFYGD